MTRHETGVAMKDDETKLLGQIKDQLLASKLLWAKEGRLLTGQRGGDRLPPGQRLVKTWPVLDLGVKPEVTAKNWTLTVDGLIANPVTLDWAAFSDLRQTESQSDIHCVTAWSRYDNRWRGVSVADLLDLVKPMAEARHVLFESYDGYTTNLPLTEFEVADALLATHWDGEPLTAEHGGPVRAVVPQLYFWKSAKWPRRLTFSAEDHPGFWEARGYHNHGNPWEEERYG